MRVTFAPEDAWNSLFDGRDKPRVFLVEERTKKPWPPAGSPNPLFLGQAKRYVDIPGIPNGTYRMHLHRRLGSCNFAHELEPRFVIDAPGARTVEVDIRHLLPGSVSGRAFLDGKPMVRSLLFFIPVSVWQESGTPWLGYLFSGGKVQTDQEGRIQKTRLPLGEYRALHGRLVSRESISVRSGQAIEVQIHFQSKRLTLKVLDAAGKPVANRPCRVLLPFWSDMATDAKGLLVLDQAPRMRTSRSSSGCRRAPDRSARAPRLHPLLPGAQEPRSPGEGLPRARLTQVHAGVTPWSLASGGIPGRLGPSGSALV